MVLSVRISDRALRQMAALCSEHRRELCWTLKKYCRRPYGHFLKRREHRLINSLQALHVIETTIAGLTVMISGVEKLGAIEINSIEVCAGACRR